MFFYIVDVEYLEFSKHIVFYANTPYAFLTTSIRAKEQRFHLRNWCFPYTTQCSIWVYFIYTKMSRNLIVSARFRSTCSSLLRSEAESELLWHCIICLVEWLQCVPFSDYLVCHRNLRGQQARKEPIDNREMRLTTWKDFYELMHWAGRRKLLTQGEWAHSLQLWYDKLTESLTFPLRYIRHCSDFIMMKCQTKWWKD